MIGERRKRFFIFSIKTGFNCLFTGLIYLLQKGPYGQRHYYLRISLTGFDKLHRR